MQLPDRLKIAMESKGISAYKISKNTKISASTIANYLSGATTPDRSKLDDLCEFLGINQSWVLTGEGTMLKNQIQSDARQLTDIQFMNVPVVHVPAQAGYGRGFGDVHYIDSLPTMPVIVDKKYNGRYMIFEVDGDSMDDGSRGSICSGDKILCREVKRELWRCKLHINDWYFVVVMKYDGISVKKITSHDVKSGDIVCHSLNSMFEDFTVNLDDVAELYSVVKIVDRNTRI